MFVSCLGDVSSHGGVIVTASSNVVADGRLVARLGDMHACPIFGHGVTPLISGAMSTDTGLGLVRTLQDVAGCGAMMVTGSSVFST
jgi:uncharacterized Zn-binding protein involved in type VI secretion